MTHARSAVLLFAAVVCPNCTLFYSLEGIGDGTGADASVVDAIAGNQPAEATPDTDGFDVRRADSIASADGAL